jgi:hypothetical protein
MASQAKAETQKIAVKMGQGKAMTDTQWILILNIAIIVLNALIAIAQYLLAQRVIQLGKQNKL